MTAPLFKPNDDVRIRPDVEAWLSGSTAREDKRAKNKKIGKLNRKKAKQ